MREYSVSLVFSLMVSSACLLSSTNRLVENQVDYDWAEIMSTSDVAFWVF